MVNTTFSRLKLVDVCPARSKIVGSTSRDLDAHWRCPHKVLPRVALDPLLDSYTQDDQDIRAKHHHTHDQVQSAGNSDQQIPANFSGNSSLLSEEHLSRDTYIR